MLALDRTTQQGHDSRLRLDGCKAAYVAQDGSARVKERALPHQRALEPMQGLPDSCAPVKSTSLAGAGQHGCMGARRKGTMTPGAPSWYHLIDR